MTPQTLELNTQVTWLYTLKIKRWDGDRKFQLPFTSTKGKNGAQETLLTSKFKIHLGKCYEVPNFRGRKIIWRCPDSASCVCSPRTMTLPSERTILFHCPLYSLMKGTLEILSKVFSLLPPCREQETQSSFKNEPAPVILSSSRWPLICTILLKNLWACCELALLHYRFLVT